MNAKSWYLLGMLALLFLANIAMLMGMTNWPQRTREGFAQAMAAGPKPAAKPKKPLSGTNVLAAKKEGFATMGSSGAAMEPLAPPTFSTITGCPRFLDSVLLTVRAMTSDSPPAG